MKRLASCLAMASVLLCLAACSTSSQSISSDALPLDASSKIGYMADYYAMLEYPEEWPVTKSEPGGDDGTYASLQVTPPCGGTVYGYSIAWDVIDDSTSNDDVDASAERLLDSVRTRSNVSNKSVERDGAIATVTADVTTVEAGYTFVGRFKGILAFGFAYCVTAAVPDSAEAVDHDTASAIVQAFSYDGDIPGE